MFNRFELSNKLHFDMLFFSSFAIFNKHIFSLYSLIYTIMKIQIYLSIYFLVILFTFDIVILELHETHENAFSIHVYIDLKAFV